MDGAVGKLVRRNEVPQVKIIPTLIGGFFRHHLPPLVICPARVKEIVMQVTVLAAADQHWLIDQQHWRFPGSLQTGLQNAESQIRWIQSWRLQPVKGVSVPKSVWARS